MQDKNSIGQQLSVNKRYLPSDAFIIITPRCSSALSENISKIIIFSDRSQLQY